jgi:molybdopterin/thiamine biosynthesis adenylyltransferase
MTFYVMGLGAVGSNLLLQLSQMFPDQKYIGVDFDTVETRNIKTQAYFIHHIGQRKSSALLSVLHTKHRKINYHQVPIKIEALDDISFDRESLVIDCFDNAKSRSLFKDIGEKGVDCLHVGFSPAMTAEIIWNEAYGVPKDVDPSQPDLCTRDDASAFIHFVVSLASMVIAKYVQDGSKENYLVLNKHDVKKL